LVTWDKPATPCLSSRIAYGQQITPVRLARVEQAESVLRNRLADQGLLVHDLRVRDLGHTVRVEVDEDLVDSISDHLDVTAIVASAGFGGTTAVTISAFHSGGLNDLLPPRERQKWAPPAG
jgi:pyridinium-3,5-biscarboxylic acid mononucleotide sulfurtransferase